MEEIKADEVLKTYFNEVPEWVHVQWRNNPLIHHIIIRAAQRGDSTSELGWDIARVLCGELEVTHNKLLDLAMSNPPNRITIEKDGGLFSLPESKESLSSLISKLPKERPSEKTGKKIYTFEEWEAGKVPNPYPDEVFKPVYQQERLTTTVDGFVHKIKCIDHYKGTKSGILLGAWFAEICDRVPSEN